MTQQVCLVTGAARGIGAAIACRLARNGAAVALIDNNVELGQHTAEHLTRLGHRTVFIRCDVVHSGDISSAVAQTVDTFGRLDVVVNNAGVNAFFDPITMTEDDWDRVLAIDLKSAWLMCKYALSHLLQTRGNIVNISSIHTMLTSPGYFPYPVAKAGLDGLTRSLALEYSRAGVRVNAVAPGFTRTALVEEWIARSDDPAETERRMNEAQPLGRICEPDDIADAVAFLASSDARSITGQVLRVDAGLSIKFAV